MNTGANPKNIFFENATYIFVVVVVVNQNICPEGLLESGLSMFVCFCLFSFSFPNYYFGFHRADTSQTF